MIDESSTLPFARTNPATTGRKWGWGVTELDGLTSVKFDPPVLDFSEKTICMQWSAVVCALGV